jgi:RNA polymerase sigma-70 factor (ECF subfamily)
MDGIALQPCDRAGDRALAALYRDNIDRLRAYLNRLLKSEADADDVAQEAFLRLCRAPDFASFNHPRAVLFKTGYRLALNRLRQRRSNPLDRSEQILDEVVCSGAVTSAEEILIAGEQEAAYGRALESLPNRCREVIELRTVQELSYKEMSETLGLSVSTLEKHLAKGKRVCAEVLSAWWAEPMRAEAA